MSARSEAIEAASTALIAARASFRDADDEEACERWEAAWDAWTAAVAMPRDEDEAVAKVVGAAIEALDAPAGDAHRSARIYLWERVEDLLRARGGR